MIGRRDTDRIFLKLYGLRSVGEGWVFVLWWCFVADFVARVSSAG
jgi:hypothetical protein